MSKLLIQDDILHGMDVYVDYTFDECGPVILDYGLELDGETMVNGANGREVVEYRTHTSLRGYINTRWMEERLEEFIMAEEGA